MKSVSKIFLYKDEPGGDSARITKVLCASGSLVEADQHLFDVETAKATQEIYAPSKGMLMHKLGDGQEVEFGAVLGEIVMEKESDGPMAGPQLVRPDPTVRGAEPLDPEGGAPVISRKAERLLQSLGIDPLSLGSALITSAVVQKRLSLPTTQMAIPATKSESRKANLSPLPWHKLQEVKALKGCAGDSFLSMVSVEMVCHGFKRPGAGFFENKILDLVVFHSANLMSQFPNLNAAYRHPDQIEHHKEIVPGVAFHGGNNLVTYAVKPQILSDISAIKEDILAGFKKYAQNKLAREDTRGTTYTISDLSTAGADFVLPLVPASQSCIIGITRSGEGFKLHAAFDHRVTDGFEVARFLKVLCGHVRKTVSEAQSVCTHCGASSEAADLSTMLLPLQDSAGNTYLCCKKCWN